MIDANALDYVKSENSQYNAPDLNSVASELRAEFRANEAQYRRFAEKRENVTLSTLSVRFCIPVVQGSIKSKTDRWEKAISALNAGDFKEYFNRCYDSDKKLRAFRRLSDSDIPERVVEALENGRENDAHALLCGRDPKTGENITETYLRANKASFVLYLLGADRKMCLDTRVYNTVKPALRALLKRQYADGIATKTHPDTELDNPYRSATPRMDARSVPVLSHSGDPEWDGEKSFLEDKLKWNIGEYDALTGELMSELAQRAGIPWELVPQVAFNANAETTTHEELMDVLVAI